MSKKRRPRRRIRPELKYAGFVLLAGIGIAMGLYWFTQDHYAYEPIEDVAMPAMDPRTYHDYDLSLLRTDDNVYSYHDENYDSMFGIDVSSHNKDIDWKAAKASGVEFAMIRMGYRGYTEGGLATDEYFEKNITEASKQGIKVGVYFFSQAVNAEEAAQEAAYVIDAIQGYQIDMPVVYDMEFYPEETNARANMLTKEERTHNAVVFLENIKNAGYTPMMYASTGTYDQLFLPGQLTQYPLWIAEYDNVCEYPYTFQIWQYSENGNAKQIPSGVDLNIAFIPKDPALQGQSADKQH